MLRLVQQLRQRYPEVQAVGAGAAGLVDWPDGHVRWAPNNSYRDLPLRAILSAETGLPAVVDNDANAAAWAEACLGAGAGRRDLLVLTVGTGIGAGLILGGRLYRGATGIGGEAGHVIVDPGGPRCGCGSTGCLEALGSGGALSRAGQEAAWRDPDGTLARLAGGPGQVTGETVFQAARDDDAIALALFAKAGYWLGVGIASLASLLDIELVVIGGGLSAAGDLLLGPARSAFERFVFARGPSHAAADRGRPARPGGRDRGRRTPGLGRRAGPERRCRGPSRRRPGHPRNSVKVRHCGNSSSNGTSTLLGRRWASGRRRAPRCERAPG